MRGHSKTLVKHKHFEHLALSVPLISADFRLISDTRKQANRSRHPSKTPPGAPPERSPEVARTNNLKLLTEVASKQPQSAPQTTPKRPQSDPQTVRNRIRKRSEIGFEIGFEEDMILLETNHLEANKLEPAKP